MKKFISGIIAGALITSSISVFANSVRNIKASFSVSKLVVNGIDTGKGSQAFISEGTTYVPLRTISDALNQRIHWDPYNRVIYINSNSSSADIPNLDQPTDLPTINTPNINIPSINNNFSPNNYISEQKAKEIALKEVGNGQVVYVKNKFRDKIPHYDIKVKKGTRYYEVEVSAIDGLIIDFDIDD